MFARIVIFCLLVSCCVGESVPVSKYKYLDDQGIYHDVNIRAGTALGTGPPKIIYDSTNYKIDVYVDEFPSEQFITYVKALGVYRLDLNEWIESLNRSYEYHKDSTDRISSSENPNVKYSSNQPVTSNPMLKFVIEVGSSTHPYIPGSMLKLMTNLPEVILACVYINIFCIVLMTVLYFIHKVRCYFSIDIPILT